MEWLAGQALTLGAGLLVIIAAIVGVTSWRRRRAAAEFESIITPVTTTIEPWEPAPPAPAFGSIGLTATAAEATPSSLAATATPVEVSVADPLQEADFHIAYGLYGQAADLLKRCIDREPARRDYQLKLLEVYYLSSNADGFIALAERLRATAASGATAEEEWARITVMGAKLLPKHPLFASAGRPVSAPSVALDVDLGQLPETGRAVDDTQPRLQPLDEHTVTMKMATQPFVEHDLTLELSTSALTEAPAASADRSEVTGTVRMLLDDAEKLRLDDFVSQHSSSSRESDAAPERAAAPPVRAAKTSDTTLVEKLSLSDLGLADLEGVTLSEVGTKLDLARAYMEMGDPDGARQILNEVIREGSPAQQSDARRLLSTIPG